MNHRDLQDQETINFLRSVLSSQKCVPFIGTGFTANERAAKNAVPNGTDWMGIMAAQINAAVTKHKPTEAEIKRYSFQDLSDVYFREKIVEFDKIKETLNDYFSNVQIKNEAKKAFLSIEWPYIYTLNIDDAIENHLGGVKVVPYEQFERHGSRTFVYKMHGDVWTALKAADAEGLKLIFGRGDYIRSLRKNEYLIECLRNDLAERNIFFIGCTFQHLRTLSKRRDEVRDANSTFVVAVSNSDVSAFYGLSGDAIFEAADRLNQSEIPGIDDFLSRIGLKKWRASARILDQIFYVSESAIVARELGESSSLQTRLNNRIEELSKKKECKVEFALLYTLAVRQKIYSAVYRKMLADAGFGRTSEAYMSEFGKNWAPFVELMESDASSDRYNRSARQLIANSSVWLHYATRSLAKRIGLDLTADYIFYAFVSSREWDDEAHELTMFDHLNAVFGPFPPIEANWSAALIRLVYLRLADVLYQVPNYWLQRAKSVYNISVDVAELKEAVAFCDKAISETDQKVTINSKLTRANLYGKLCRITEYKDEDLILRAIKIYYDALQDYDQNSTHINDLLKKSRSGRGDLKLLVSHVDSMPKSAKFITVRSEFSLISGFLAGKIAY